MTSKFDYLLIGFEESIKKLNSKTIKCYIQDISQFEIWLEKQNIPFDRIILKDFEQYLQFNSFKISTLKRKLQSIKAFYRFLEKNNIFSNNPFQNYSFKESVAIQNPILLSKSHISKIIKLAEQQHESVEDKSSFQSYSTLRDKLIIELLTNTGLRVSEICQLKLSDFKDNFSSLVVPYDNRILLLRNETKLMLHTYYNDYNGLMKNDIMFVNRLHNQMTEQSIRIILSNIAKKLNIKISPKILRNTYANNLVNTAKDLKTIKDNLGLTSLTSIQRYLNID